ncbi:hypothetical protein EAH81_05985 [Flavobacterium pectinovorum]|uniref:Uncharacterized protein n=2 Tax=Flavobacterium pectinovorum TaxID=29533 RepID=A0A502F1J9_9FLAO|nr:hypothetical protein EAH81_05985 [Flavobacterium pectinovorum]
MLVSCENQNLKSQLFLEHNFLKIIDAEAHPEGFTQRKITKLKKSEKTIIQLDPKIAYNEDADELLVDFFDKNPFYKDQFKDLIYDISYNEFSIDHKFAKQIGGYSIHFNSSRATDEPRDKNTERFAVKNFKSFDNKAMLVLSKTENKHIIVSVLLFVKNKSKWAIVKREILAKT